MITCYQQSSSSAAIGGVIAVEMPEALYKALVAQGCEFLDLDSPEVQTYLSAQNSPAKITERVSAALQSEMDKAAQSLGYDDIARMTTYFNSGVTAFKSDAQKAIDWRDEVWSWAGKLRENVQSGNTTVPTVEAVLADMPKCPWSA